MIEIRRIGGDIDEVVARDASVHVERMSNGEFFVGITTTDGEVKLFIAAKAARGHVVAYVSEKAGNVTEKKR